MFATYYMKAIKILYLRCCYLCEIGILKGKYFHLKPTLFNYLFIYFIIFIIIIIIIIKYLS